MTDRVRVCPDRDIVCPNGINCQEPCGNPALSHPAPDVPSDDDVDAIRARAEAAPSGFLEMSPAERQMYTDRAALLAKHDALRAELDAARAELAGVREASTVFLQAADQFEGEDDTKKLYLALRVGDLRRLAAALAKDAT